MTGFAIVERLDHVPRVHAWALDFPANGQAPKINERGLYLQGWLLERAGVARGMLLVRADASGVVRELPFNNARPDVIQRVLGSAAETHPQLRCGFIAYLADPPSAFSLGVQLDGEPFWLCRVRTDATTEPAKPVPAMQVIQGTDGWLFLDNDTNRSVDQFTGKLMLDGEGLQRWRNYLNQFSALAEDARARHAVVIAASKEQVLAEYYPHKKAPTTVHEQVLALCKPEHRIVDTAALLAAREDREACFIKTDTHWTDRGARHTVFALLRELGLDTSVAQACFAEDVYYDMNFCGDLGVKLEPKVKTPTEFLRAPAVVSAAVFDNGLPNIGRVLVFEAQEAPWSLSLLVFGASSSYPMLKYLRRLFRRVVFVHSAGNVDRSVIALERPDLLVTQTTARFMIEPPGTGFNLKSAVAGKLSKAQGDAPAAAVTVSDKNRPYLEMMEGAQ